MELLFWGRRKELLIGGNKRSVIMLGGVLKNASPTKTANYPYSSITALGKDANTTR
jgi:hypothetical protein